MRMMFIGAHPDDGDISAGGTAARLIELGGEVMFVAICNGNAGHYKMSPATLAARRKREAGCAGEVIGAQYRVLSHDDARLQPTIEIREEVIRLIRRFNPDLVITLRPLDYHPDHRAAGQIVSDASYLLTVPMICPDEPAMKRMPVICHSWDHFRKPIPFQPDLAVAVDDYFESKVKMLACHESQFFEWLPFNRGQLHEVPDDPTTRWKWLYAYIDAQLAPIADLCRNLIIERYGPRRGVNVRHAEVFEVCEYGDQPDRNRLENLFP